MTTTNFSPRKIIQCCWQCTAMQHIFQTAEEQWGHAQLHWQVSRSVVSEEPQKSITPPHPGIEPMNHGSWKLDNLQSRTFITQPQTPISKSTAIQQSFKLPTVFSPTVCQLEQSASEGNNTLQGVIPILKNFFNIVPHLILSVIPLPHWGVSLDLCSW